MKKVFVGLSGGVDSSVAALLLKEQGFAVTGVYMKNWSKDLPGMPCPWMEDYQDAKRIAVQLGIDFKMYDFQDEYQHKVVDYMLEEFRAGRTPNPDIKCNQEVKFKLFLNTCVEDGADFIATGHYARVEHAQAKSQKPKAKSSHLLRAKDENKDQTYFLYRMTQDALSKTLFPLGELTKPEVRKIAEENGLVTASKKESMGICFVGKVGIKDFLQHELFQDQVLEKGAIIDQNGKIIGEHDGAIFYTLGQRHELEVGGGPPYYVTDKDMAKNEVYVTTDIQDPSLWSHEIKLTNVHWINDTPGNSGEWRVESMKNSHLSPLTSHITVRTRHRAKLVPVKELKELGSGKWSAILEEEVRALTPGQSAVFYSGDECIGGGIVV